MRMLLKFLTLFLCCLVFKANAQTQTNKNALVISVPLIWNNSELIDDAPNIKTGNAISYGINFNYSRVIVSKWYGIIGVGFFKQRFGIRRTYDPSPSSVGPAVYAQTYNYNNVHLKIGLGYSYDFGKKVSANGSIDFNEFYSFRQKYSQSKNSVANNWMPIGESVNINLGINKKLAGNFSIGTDVVFPMIVDWKTDKAFGEYPEIARNKLSLGLEVKGKYHF